MDAKARSELIAIKTELRSIIKELQEVSDGVRGNFKGIGNEQCATCIDRVVDNYEKVEKELNKIDTKGSHGGGGRRG